MTTIHMGARPGARPATDLARADQWQDSAACQAKDVDPELFFSTAQANVAKAKGICGRCPVYEQCRRWALETRQDFGVLGGLSEVERRRIHRRWKRPPEGAGHFTRADQIAADPATYRRLVALRLTPAQIAARYNTNVSTINQVARMLEVPAEQESAGAK